MATGAIKTNHVKREEQIVCMVRSGILKSINQSRNIFLCVFTATQKTVFCIGMLS